MTGRQDDAPSRPTEQVDAQMYRLLSEQMADVVLASQAGVVTWASASCRQVLGREPETMVGTRLAELVHPDDIGPPTLTPQDPVRTVRHRLRTRDRGYRWFETHIVARFDENGAPLSRYGAARDIDDQVRLAEDAITADRRLRDALDASPDGFALYTAVRDDTGRVTDLRLASINVAGAAGFQGDPSMLVGQSLLTIYPQAADNGLYRDLVAALTTGQPQHSRAKTVGPSWAGVLDGVQVRLDHDTVMSTWRDVTAAIEAEDRLTQAYEEMAAVRATLETALDATSDGFFVFELTRDAEGVISGMRTIHANAAGRAAVAAHVETPTELVGCDPRELLPGFVDSGLWDKCLAAIAEQSARTQRIHINGPAGSWLLSLDTTVAAVGTNRLVLTARDVTDDERHRRQVDQARSVAEHAATHDALTGLPNRALFLQRLRDALQDTRSGQQVAVVYCDLNNFKTINDTFGHAVGDTVLQATARRLSGSIRPHDTAARLAGDEFVLLLRHLPATWDAEGFLARTGAALNQPIWVDEKALSTSTSLGLAITGSDTDADSLLARADQAMYQAKADRLIPAPRPPGTPDRDDDIAQPPQVSAAE